MGHLVTFKTAKFDISAETPNPINPIAGESVLNWLRKLLAKTNYRFTQPNTEDWGWYMDVQGEGASYLGGASADAESRGSVEYVIQVHKVRSLSDKLVGRNKMAVDDPLFGLIERIVWSDAAIVDVSVEKESGR
jgi:hypothetical protein